MVDGLRFENCILLNNINSYIFTGAQSVKLLDNGSVNGIAAANNMLYLTDPKSGILSKIDYSGNNEQVIVESDDFTEPTAVTVVSKTGEIYVAHNSYPNKISRVSPSGEVTFVSSSSNPSSLAVDPETGVLYYTDERDTLVKRLAPGMSGYSLNP